MIKRENALLGWNYTDTDTLQIEDVRVIDITSLKQGEWIDRHQTIGANTVSWCQGGFGPESQFAIWAWEGFADPTECRMALLELAKIEGCEWAITALGAITNPQNPEC